jgi:HD superfamily phosphohydrolase
MNINQSLNLVHINTNTTQINIGINTDMKRINTDMKRIIPDNEPKSILLKDCIYGHISISPLCKSFMDIDEFQRLRRIRQLGMVQYSYPSATHTRFEHSLGVMHLVGKIVDQFRKFIKIPERTKELIQLGGLYHDIGHFSYSHLFDTFLSHIDLESIPDIFRIHNHEDRSTYFLQKVNAKLKLLTDVEENFVINVIKGNIPKNHPSYLYQIVCNQECGVDMDKLDYLNRDAFHTGFPGFQGDYIIINAVIDKESSLAFRNKAYEDLKDLFDVRRRMYENVYRHHTVLRTDKIYFCMMKRLGPKLFMYGEMTDDFNIETLFRNSPETMDLIKYIDNRDLDHDCDICKEYPLVKSINNSGCIDKVRFV